MLTRAWEVVRTIELDPITFDNGDCLRFRIEIQRSIAAPDKYRARVFRIEMFQLRPTFPDGSRESTDEVVLSDDSYTGDVSGGDADEVLAIALAQLDRQFGRQHRT